MTSENIKWAIFSGSSDDTFGIIEAADGVPVVDHDDCAQCSRRVIRLAAPSGEELLIAGQYSDFKMRGGQQGSWMVGVLAPDSWGQSGRAWPWPLEYVGMEEAALLDLPTYSPHLKVHMPVGTRIEVDNGRSKDGENEGIAWGLVE